MEESATGEEEKRGKKKNRTLLVVIAQLEEVVNVFLAQGLLDYDRVALILVYLVSIIRNRRKEGKDGKREEKHTSTTKGYSKSISALIEISLAGILVLPFLGYSLRFVVTVVVVLVPEEWPLLLEELEVLDELLELLRKLLVVRDSRSRLTLLLRVLTTFFSRTNPPR